MLGIERTKNTAIPGVFGVGRPAIALYTARRRRFLTTALLAIDFGATAAARKVPGTFKNFAEIGLFLPFRGETFKEMPFLSTSSTSREERRELFLSMNLDSYSRAALAATANYSLAPTSSRCTGKKTVSSRSFALFWLIGLRHI